MLKEHKITYLLKNHYKMTKCIAWLKLSIASVSVCAQTLKHLNFHEFSENMKLRRFTFFIFNCFNKT